MPVNHVNRVKRTICLFGSVTLATVVGPAAVWSESGAPDLWRPAQAVRSELLAMLADAERGDAAASAKHAGNAAAAYAHIGTSVASTAPGADGRIRAELDLLTGLRDSDLARQAFARGRVLGELAAAARLGAIAATRAEDPDHAVAWLALREYRRATRVTLVHSLASRAVEDLAAGSLGAEAAAAIVRDDLDDTYHARVGYAAGSALKAADRGLVIRAAESAGLIGSYLSMFGDDFVAKQGQGAWTALQGTSDALTEAALAADPDGVRAAATGLMRQWRGYQAVELPAEELARRADLMQLFLELVAIEYRDGVRNGRISIEAEYAEAVAFLEQAIHSASELSPRIAAVDEAEAARLEVLLEDLRTQVAELGPTREVVEKTAEARAIVTATLGAMGGIDGDSVFTVIAQMFDSLDGLVRKGDWTGAERMRIQVYGLFDAGPELSLLGINPPLAHRIDALFWSGTPGTPGLATVIAGREAFHVYLATAARLRTALGDAQAVLSDDAAPAAAAVNAAVIVFREGLEAVVILAALVAGMVGAAAAFRRPLYVGAVVALAASAATWFAAHRLVHLFRTYGERLEAIVSLVAVAMLLIITNWFFHKVYWSGWIAKFHGRKRLLLAGAAGQAVGFGLLGFASVYREGFETALFLQALIFRARVETVLAGVALGLAGVAVVGILTFRLEKKLPYKKMLVVTGVLIGAVLVTLSGTTVHIMQAVGWVPLSPIFGLALPYWIGNWFGVYPTWQTLGGQAAAAGFVIGSYFVARARLRGGVSRVPERLASWRRLARLPVKGRSLQPE